METGWPDLQQRRGESELEKMGAQRKGKKKKKKRKREKEIVKKKKKLKKRPVCPFFYSIKSVPYLFICEKLL